jgi:hypothetical protein
MTLPENEGAELSLLYPVSVLLLVAALAPVWLFGMEAVVEWALTAGQLDTAIAVNDYYTTKWTNADKAERSAIIKYYRVDGDWLAKNDSYLQSLSAKTDAEAAPSSGE